MIVDTESERLILRKMLADACAGEVLDVAAFLMKIMVKDRAEGKYGEGGLSAVDSSGLDLGAVICDQGWRGAEAIEDLVDDIVDSLVPRPAQT